MHEGIWYDNNELVLVEIQSTPDAKIEQRLLGYTILAHRYHKRFVNAYVIFLRDGGEMLKPLLVRKRADGRDGLIFHYEVIILRNIPYQDLLASARRGIWPLIAFAKGGKRPEVVDTVLTRFASEPNEMTRELLSLTALFASLAFTDPQDRRWLERRLAMLEDILSEAPLYKSLIARGEEEGREKEREKQLLSLRTTLIDLFQESFPQLSVLAQEKLPVISDPDVLQKLIVRVARARDEKDAKTYLLEAVRPNGM
ncbi:hypothetical protein KSF_083300 [Reticulibacter mediterranei]|uniref:Transposase (putative) YhgA-like domain-containing protein n=1 Tax=Reticulibacter mediterranei TaxID=2778369 RepID=A0A8J3N8I2_9CHLR|nr:hypothetical protein [Reticulibacter mediterranei]GHO98282.1 hypothetical protein KSF_083300 [Reticulibacter mediterranei]